MHKALSGAALLTLIALPAQAEPKNITYEFRFLSETERLADGTVEVVPVTLKDIFATLVLTHDAMKDREATVVFTGGTSSGEDKGVVSFVLTPYPTEPLSILDFPLNPVFHGPINMDLEIHGGELSGSIQMDVGSAAVACNLTMQGIDGNWSGTWQCVNPLGVQPLFAFTAIPFRAEHEKVADR